MSDVRVEVTETPHVDRSNPRYSPEAVQVQIDQHLAAADSFEKLADDERAKAREMKKYLVEVQDDADQQMRARQKKG